jgi:tetratricopeptide (TPR) repeat protein
MRPVRSIAPILMLLVGTSVLPAVVLAQGGGKAAADEPVIATPTEYSEAARRAYIQGLKEARDLIVSKQYTDAIAKLDALQKQRPREPQARFLRAVAMSESGRSDDAIVALRDLVADFPELPEAHNNLAVLYAAKGELNAARDELAIAIAARPDYAVAHENLGDVYVRLALRQYEQAAKLEPANKSIPGKLKLAREIVPAAPPR